MFRDHVAANAQVSAGALRGILDTVPVGIALFGPAGTPRLVNRTAREILGDLASAPLARWADHRRITLPDGSAATVEDLPPWATLKDGQPRREVALNVRSPDGRTVPVLASTEAVFEPDGGIQQVACSLTPVHTVREQERENRRLLKQEAICSLATSLAGPFNDVLTAITGHCELARARVPACDPLAQILADIQQAGERAAALTGRLLAHGEREVARPRVLELDAWLTTHFTALSALAGEHLDVELAPGAPDVCLEVDPDLLEQILAALVTNAREACGDHGTIGVETALVQIDPDLAPLLGATEAGGYGVITVRDSGGGMEEPLLKRIFEPFFTTKEHALGLGLTTVERLVRAQGGHVRIENRRGEQVAFHVHFPITDAAAGAEGAGEALPVTSTEEEPLQVLLVEDDAVVRDLVHQVLELEHLDVHEARTTADAIRAIEDGGRRIDLLISDVVLPGEGGGAIAERARELHPDVRVLMMSGCSDAERLGRALAHEANAFLAKPFTPEGLRRALRTVLASAASPSAESTSSG